MANWIESAVTFDKMMENGTVKKVTEKNLFDALSFTECEARTIEELTPYISGEFTVKAVKKTKISEIFFNDTADNMLGRVRRHIGNALRSHRYGIRSSDSKD